MPIPFRKSKLNPEMELVYLNRKIRKLERKVLHGKRKETSNIEFITY